MEIDAFRKRAWAEIDLKCVEDNFNVVRRRINQNVKVCCVIKANAYGHGAVELAKYYEQLGADYFAVSNIEEALQLRQNGVVHPILILGYTDTKCAALLAANNISQCVFSWEYGKMLSESARQQNVEVKVHIKLDTGMGRLGFLCKNEDKLAISEIRDVCTMPGIYPEGVFTHFAISDEGDDGREYTLHQFACFTKTIDLLEKDGITFQIRHCANSAAIFAYPQMHLDMVRAGIVLYGMWPSQNVRTDCELKQVMTLHSIVDYIKEVAPGESVGYGREYKADQRRYIATVPIGYADGLWRSNAKNGIVVKIGEEYAPVVGRICMDQCMLDITNLNNVTLGSKVTIYGRDEKTSLDHIARINNTINYEIACALGERIPRVYTKDGIIEKIVDHTVNL